MTMAQPIANAPKDGSRILGYIENPAWLGWAVIRWSEGSEPNRDAGPGWYCDEIGRRVWPEVWQSLPEASS